MVERHGGGDLIEGPQVAQFLELAEERSVVREPPVAVAIVERDNEQIALARQVERPRLPLLVGHRAVQWEVVDPDGDLDDPPLEAGLGGAQRADRARQPLEVVPDQAHLGGVGPES